MLNLAKRFGTNLRKHRENCGLTQFQLGIELDLTEATIANYEAGRRWPQVEIIEAICVVLKIDPEVLFVKEFQAS